MPQSIHFRPETDQLRADIVKRAGEKGLSVNEWMNRALTHALLKGGTIETTVVTKVDV